MNVEVNKKTGESKHRFRRELPPEEAIRVPGRQVATVRRAQGIGLLGGGTGCGREAVEQETLAEVVDIQGLRDYWSEVVEGSKVAQAYYVITDGGQISDVQLADLWLNSDSLHTQPIQSDVGKDLNLNQRYQSGGASRIRCPLRGTASRHECEQHDEQRQRIFSAHRSAELVGKPPDRCDLWRSLVEPVRRLKPRNNFGTVVERSPRAAAALWRKVGIAGLPIAHSRRLCPERRAMSAIEIRSIWPFVISWHFPPRAKMCPTPRRSTTVSAFAWDCRIIAKPPARPVINR